MSELINRLTWAPFFLYYDGLYGLFFPSLTTLTLWSTSLAPLPSHYLDEAFFHTVSKWALTDSAAAAANALRSSSAVSSQVYN